MAAASPGTAPSGWSTFRAPRERSIGRSLRQPSPRACSDLMGRPRMYAPLCAAAAKSHRNLYMARAKLRHVIDNGDAHVTIPGRVLDFYRVTLPCITT